MDGNGSRTLVLGFDALDLTYLDRFAESLPNFEALRSSGVEAPLESTFPPWTASAWPSMYTGVDPSHHGVYGFFDVDGYPLDADIISRNDVKAPAIWNYLDGRDRTSVVMNVPVTHPAEEIDGVVIPGYLANEEADGHPAGIRDELSDAIGEEYRVYSRAETADDHEEKLDGFVDLIRLRERAAVELLATRDWEFAFVQVQKTDTVFHSFDDDTAFRRVYEAADDLLGAVLDAVDDDVNVVVCSDHGIGPKRGYQIHVNDVLRDHGFVEATTEHEYQSLSTMKGELTGEADDAADETPALVDRGLSTLWRTLDAAGVSPGELYRTVERLGLGDAVLDVLPDSVRDAASQNVDWRASRAYCRGSSRLGVRINLEGREPNGVVPEDEYERVRTEIIDVLRELKTPDGRPAFEFVVRREEIYDGPFAEGADDVLFLPADMDHSVSTKLYGQRFVSVDDYDHKRDGVFLAAGPAFDESASIESLSLTDVAPAAIASMGLPVPSRMTGSVPRELLRETPETAEYADIEYESVDEDEPSDDEEVTERLEDLGYL
ncbi:nucleotide pyrophosphatase [Halostella sp. JP-L12]|uniref:alkaline phosphatase family protein n=1 Tax=Halostella TaxID=1843185 RepID=UPI000EF7B097|nr:MULTISPECIES: alkaline phosphatase family protein [Halostella]NHN49862.1 nucleotide pyrophosphatase [Halostella sp. JP-L12]